MNWDERNAIHHQKTLHLSLNEVLAQSHDTYRRLLQLVETLSEEFLTQPLIPI